MYASCNSSLLYIYEYGYINYTHLTQSNFTHNLITFKQSQSMHNCIIVYDTLQD